jgi:tetratricopeptide (TPR) repeat protein
MDEELYKQGLEQARQGDKTGAIASFTQALQANPWLADAYYQRGLAYYDLGELQQAAFDYTEAIKHNLRQANYHCARALVRVALKYLPGAWEDVEAAIGIDPYHAQAYYLKGIIARKQGSNANAILSWKQAAQLYLDQKDPDNCRRCLANIEQLQSPKQPDLIPANPSQAQIVPQTPEVIYRQMWHQAQNGEAKKALELLNWAIAMDNRDAIAYCYRGLVYSITGQNREALADLNRSLQLDPENSLAYQNRAQLKAKIGDYGGAIADLERVFEIVTPDAELLLVRANIYQQMGNYIAAIEDYSQSLNLAPKQPEVYYHRAMAYSRIEEIKQAVADYQQAATLYSEQNNWEKYQSTLERLKQVQSATPIGKPKAEVKSNPLWERLIVLVGGQVAMAERLVEQLKLYYPGMAEDWYLEKVLYDIEQGNFRGDEE